ncbi:MAG: TIM barrel protein [Alistipes sp.]|nr:TIM barrel protein [Alistipes sp.]
MDRLGFFKQGLSSLIEVAQSIVGLKHAAESFTEAVDEALSNIKTDIGLHLLSVDGDIYDQPKGTLMELARMGYSTLETGLYYGGKVHGMSAEAFKALANEAGLKITAAHLNHLYEVPVKGPDKENTGANDGPDKGDTNDVNGEAVGVVKEGSAAQAAGVEGAAGAVKGEAAEDANKEVAVDDENDPNYQWWSKALDTHLKLGCQYITSSRIADYPTAEDVVTYAEYFNNIGRWTADRGMQFCYHPDAAALRKKDGEKSIFEIIAERCDQEKVCFQIDTFEALEAGVDVMELLKTYGKRIILLHLHDERNTCESGRIDFDSIIKKGIETGVKDIFIEVRSYSFPPMKCVERSLYNVQALHSIRY